MQAISKSRLADVPVIPCQNPDTNEYDGNYWSTLSKLRFSIDDKLYTIPSGYITNFGSVPWFLRGLISTADESLLAYILHDYFYGKDCDIELTRKEIDNILMVVAIGSGQKIAKAFVCYKAVRFFGGKYYKARNNMFNKPTKKLLTRICRDNDYQLKSKKENK